MAKAKKSIFFCQNCGHEESKWLGQCPVCRQWNTFVEEKVTVAKTGGQTKSLKEAEVVALSSVQTDREERVCTGIGELDRVLEAERIIFEALAPYENVRVFSFFDDAEIATNFDLYSDTVHFLPEINTEIFEMTVAGEYQLTVENVDARIAAQRAMIEGYDYAALFAQEEEEE